MDELIDVLDEKTGEKTGDIISKNEAHKKDVLIKNFIQILGISQ